MLDSIAAGTFWLSIMFGIGLGVVGITGANIYDFKTTKERKASLRHPYARKLRRRPVLSVIILSRNNSAEIQACLLSVLRSNYRKIQIIIVDRASTDGTQGIVKQMIVKYPSRGIKLIAKRLNSNEAQSIKQARRYASGDITFTISANNTVEKTTLRNLSYHFITNPRLEHIYARLVIQSDPSLTGLGQKMAQNTANWLQKTAFRACDYRPLLQASRVGKNSAHRSKYYTDVVVFQSSVSHFRRLWIKEYNRLLNRKRNTQRTQPLFPKNSHTLFRKSVYLVILVQAFLIPYLVYIAVSFDNPLYLFLAWSVFSVLAAVMIWSEEETFLTKLRASLYIPMLYCLFWFYCTLQLSILLAVIVSAVSKRLVSAFKELLLVLLGSTKKTA